MYRRRQRTDRYGPCIRDRDIPPDGLFYLHYVWMGHLTFLILWDLHI